jgi:hypothetical protein
MVNNGCGQWSTVTATFTNGIIGYTTQKALFCPWIGGYIEELFDLGDNRLATAGTGDLCVFWWHEFISNNKFYGFDCREGNRPIVLQDGRLWARE